MKRRHDSIDAKMFIIIIARSLRGQKSTSFEASTAQNLTCIFRTRTIYANEKIE